VANAGKIGGGGRVLMDLMLHLDPQRYTSILVAPELGPLTEWAAQAGVPFHISPAGDWLAAKALVRRTARLLRIMRQERVSIVHTAAPTCYRAAGIAGRIAGIARVCHLGFPPMPGEFERSFLAPPEAVIGCYAGQAREHAPAIWKLRPDCDVVGIHNGIDTKRFSPRTADNGLRKNAPQVIGILGHISEVKGHPEFVEAAGQISRELPHARFVVIGGETIQQGLRSRLQERAEALGIADRLDFLGFRSDVADVLPALDLVVLPSHAEGFPLAVLEAMACGRPVVATDVGGVAEAVVAGVTGTLVPVGNVRVLADAVTELLRRPDALRAMGAAARERVERLFSIERFVSQVEDVYDASLRQRRMALWPIGAVSRGSQPPKPIPRNDVSG
jgi:glycosyltransferase involved in cell wall biosynthesis